MKYNVLLCQNLRLWLTCVLSPKCNGSWKKPSVIGKLHVIHIIFFGHYFHYEAP